MIEKSWLLHFSWLKVSDCTTVKILEILSYSTIVLSHILDVLKNIFERNVYSVTLWVFNWRLSEASSQIYKYQNKNVQKSQKVEYIF